MAKSMNEREETREYHEKQILQWLLIIR
jgi:hypothetical protein